MDADDIAFGDAAIDQDAYYLARWYPVTSHLTFPSLSIPLFDNEVDAMIAHRRAARLMYYLIQEAKCVVCGKNVGQVGEDNDEDKGEMEIGEGDGSRSKLTPTECNKTKPNDGVESRSSHPTGQYAFQETPLCPHHVGAITGWRDDNDHRIPVNEEEWAEELREKARSAEDMSLAFTTFAKRYPAVRLVHSEHQQVLDELAIRIHAAMNSLASSRDRSEKEKKGKEKSIENEVGGVAKLHSDDDENTDDHNNNDEDVICGSRNCSFFVKTSCRSPKDASLIQPCFRSILLSELRQSHQERPLALPSEHRALAFCRASILSLRCSSGSEAMSLLLSSQRVYDDLCLYRSRTTLQGHSLHSLSIVLRQWVEIDPAMELRAHIRDGQLTALTQYHEQYPLPLLLCEDYRSRLEASALTMVVRLSECFPQLPALRDCAVDFAPARDVSNTPSSAQTKKISKAGGESRGEGGRGRECGREDGRENGRASGEEKEKGRVEQSATSQKKDEITDFQRPITMKMIEVNPPVPMAGAPFFSLHDESDRSILHHGPYEFRYCAAAPYGGPSADACVPPRWKEEMRKEQERMMMND